MAGSVQSLIREALDLAKSVVVLEKFLIAALDAKPPSTEAEHELCAFLTGRPLSDVFTLYNSADPDAERLRAACGGWALPFGEHCYIVKRDRFDKLLAVWRK